MSIQPALFELVCSHVSLSYAQQNNIHDIDGLVQDCSISIANILEILQSCTKPSIYVLSEL